MHTRHSRLLSALVISAAATALGAGYAQAGFQYVPSNGGPAASQGVMTPAPVTATPVPAPPAQQPPQQQPAPQQQPHLLKIITPAPAPAPVQQQAAAPQPLIQQMPAPQAPLQQMSEQQAHDDAAALKPVPQIIWNPAPAKQPKPAPAATVSATPEPVEAMPVAAPPAAPAHDKNTTAEELNQAYNNSLSSQNAPGPIAATPDRELMRRPGGLEMPPDLGKVPAPANQKSAGEIAVEAASAPAAKPADAPAAETKSAEAQPQISKRLIINPFPQKGGGDVNAGGASNVIDADQVPASVNTGVGSSSAPAADADNNNGGGMAPVAGFGSDIPLALALQQIAPPEYTFSFGTNVDPGVKISWDGNNRPWDQVISETLAPLGLQSSVEGHTVHISRADGAVIEGEKHSAADLPPDQEKIAADAEANLHRSNITDPGEDAKVQPLSTLESMEAQEKQAAQTGDQPADDLAAADPAPADDGADAVPLLPADDAAAQAPAATSPAATTNTASFTTRDQLAGTVPGVRGRWEAHQGDSLRDTLNAWSKQAKMDLVWNATHDYTVDADVTVTDTFQSAVNMVVAEGVKADKPVVRIEGGKITVADKS